MKKKKKEHAQSWGFTRASLSQQASRLYPKQESGALALLIGRRKQ